MFTGIIEEVGTIEKNISLQQGRHLRIHTQKIIQDLELGASVAVNGVCLTVSKINKFQFEAIAVGETVKRTTLGFLRIGERVNLERPLRLNDRFGGHMVMGHVDGVGIIRQIKKVSVGYIILIEIPKDLTKYTIEKGSITVDGISLTIAQIIKNVVTLSIIPHTWDVTGLNDRKRGDRVNIEVDFLGKYVEQFMKSYRQELYNDRLKSFEF